MRPLLATMIAATICCTCLADDLAPYLKPGFPVSAYAGGGSYTGGPSICVLVADVDPAPGLELFATGLATGPLYGFHADGTPMTGWPTSPGPASYIGAGNLLGDEYFEVVAGYRDSYEDNLFAFDAAGSTLAGWGDNYGNYYSIAPVVADLDGDGSAEVIFNAEDYYIHLVDAERNELPGWPQWVTRGSQRTYIPLAADLDGDGVREIIAPTGGTSAGKGIEVWNLDGSDYPSFPLLTDDAYGYGPGLAVGDVDGDGQPEIVAHNFDRNAVTVLETDGSVAPGFPVTVGSASYHTKPSLADLDGDTFPEIICTTSNPFTIHVLTGDGSPLPGWPVSPAGHSGDWRGNFTPVVGDVDCDGLPEVVVGSQVAGNSVNAWLHALNADGTPLPGFPAAVELGSGGTPAIADIDGDGANELIAVAHPWDGYSGYQPLIYAWCLCDEGETSGPALWGQLGGNAGHTGWYADSAPDPCFGFTVGDANCDGVIDFDDIDPFVAALGGEEAYMALHPDCDWICNNDIDGDGTVSFDDIDPFVALLGG